MNKLIRVTRALVLGFFTVFPALAGEPLTHSFLATGADTRIVDANGKVTWKYPLSTRDGWVLPNGHLLLAVSKSKEYPGGGVAEVTREGKILFTWQGTQAEVNTVQALPDDKFLVSEAGPQPRLLEIDRQGKILLAIPLRCQTTNHHMQSRMARKLANGNYLVPQLFDKVVREYDATGRVVWEVKTPHWPFTAIRLPNGHTLINCTYGNVSIEVDREGRTVWELSNKGLPEPLIKDACGGQRLPNGNTVICAYGVGANRTKLLEVTPDKKVVWTFTDPDPHGIHEVQILETNGKPVPGTPLR
jgi:PQQ-like domain